MNYNNVFSLTSTNELLPSSDIQSLLRKIANRESLVLNGKTYTTSQVADMARRLQAGEKPRRTSPYAVDFLAEQGAQVFFSGISPTKEQPIVNPKPDQELVSPPVAKIEPLDGTVQVKAQDLKMNNGMIDIQGVKVDSKRYKYGVSLKEDLLFFCTHVKVDQREGIFVWSGVIKPLGPYTQFDLKKSIPYSVLDSKIPDKKLKGLQLYEWLLEHPDYHPLIRTVVAYLLEDDTVPLMEDGKQVEQDGLKVVVHANSLLARETSTELVRLSRPPPMSFQAKKGYAGAKFIDSMFVQINKKNFIRTNNAYYDGLDASIDRDSIRSKIEIIMEYAQNFPRDVIIVTGIEEEGLALKKSLTFLGINSTVMNERSSANYNSFKIWMKEKNIEETVAIGEKLIVLPVIAKDGAILRAVYKNHYARGFGLMTNLLVHHYSQKDCPTSTAVGVHETEQCSVTCGEDVYVFKQLPSKKPLHYYPYIYSDPETVARYIGTNESRITRTWRHMWTLLSWPRSKLPYTSRFYYCPVPVFWRKGKDLMDFTVENEDFKEIVRTVKLEDEQKVSTGTVLRGVKKIVTEQVLPSNLPMNTRIPQHGLGQRTSALTGFSLSKEPPKPGGSIVQGSNSFSFSFPPSQQVAEKCPPNEQIIDSDDEDDELRPE